MNSEIQCRMGVHTKSTLVGANNCYISMLPQGQFKCSDRAILSLRIWLDPAVKDLHKTFPEVNFLLIVD